MSSTVNMTIGTMAVVGVGMAVEEQSFDVKIFVAGGVVALMLSALENVDTRLAQLFAGAILLTALYKYAIPIANKLGLLNGSKANKAVAQARAKQRRKGR